MLAAGTALITLGMWAGGIGFLGVSAVLLVGGSLLRASGNAVPLLNSAYAAAQQGKITEAEALLDRVELGKPIPYVRRVADLQRASLALRRGDLDAAATRLDATLARPTGVLTGRDERAHVLGARAARALVLASKGDAARARTDIAAVRESPHATGEILARAEVAEAILLEREGDRDALAAHLGGARRLLLDHTVPRERAIVRAYQRMLEAPKTSVYRQAAARGDQGREEPALADWIARIAPSAAPFVRAANGPAGSPPRTEVARAEPGLVKLAEQRMRGQTERKPQQRSKVAVLWVLLIILLGALWRLLTLTGGEGAPAVRDATAILTPLVAVLMALFVVLIRRNLGVADRLAVALGMLARGDESTATRELAALAGGRATLVAAQAHLQLARIASRRADFEQAIRRCDEAIGRLGVQPGMRELASPILLPDLLAERAYALAAVSKHDEARAEMEVIRTSFPSYPFRASAEVRIALMERIRRDDLDGAARVADERHDDVPLPLRDETLADLARILARVDAGHEVERARIVRELRADGDLRAFVESVAPDLLARFSRGGSAESHPTRDRLTRDRLTRDDPTSDDPTRDRLTRDDPTRDRLTRDGPTRDGPTQDDPTRDDPTSDIQAEHEALAEDEARRAHAG
jgi:tetratricopeptide (TPR) repeat protein